MSFRALEVLEQTRVAGGGDRSSGRRRAAAGHWLRELWRALLRRLRIDTTVHGFRSLFCDCCGEAGALREVAEECLAQAIRYQVVVAHARSDLVPSRREVMQAWADQVAG